MRKGLIYSIILLVGLWAQSVSASETGLILANNILGGAASGTVVGLSAGILAYGVDRNYHAEYILNGALYGFLGGAILGGGLATYEISTRCPDTGYTLSQYLVGGTGIGALVGGVVSAIPFVHDKNGEDFTTGIGLGGVLGAGVGFLVAMIDINSRASDKPALLSSAVGPMARVGLLEIRADLPAIVPGIDADPVPNCRLLQVAF